jgi:glycosyltransferase involved in cell wall biosynthesis
MNPQAQSARTRIAVVVTSYNYRDFVVEAVDSALAQTRAPTTIVVVDDGSTDGSADLLRARYAGDSRVTLLCGANTGQLGAFRRGIDAVDADVVCFLDADDRWEPGHLEAIGACFDARPDIDMVYTDVRLFGNESHSIAYAAQPLDLGYTALATWANAHWYGAPTSALAIRLELGRRCLDLPEAVAAHWRLCADNCLVFGASVLGGRKYFLPSGTVAYRIHGRNGWWSKRSADESYRNRLRSRALIAHYARVAGLDPECFELVKREYATKPAPTWAETRRYMRLAWQRSFSTTKGLERALGILGRHVRMAMRRRAGRRNPDA